MIKVNPVNQEYYNEIAAKIEAFIVIALGQKPGVISDFDMQWNEDLKSGIASFTLHGNKDHRAFRIEGKTIFVEAIRLE